VSKLTDIPIGIYEKALPPDLSWDGRLRAAAQASYDFMEISIDESDERLARLDWDWRSRAALRRAMSATGVRILTMCLSALRRFPLGSASETIRQKSFDIVKRAIDFALDVGVRVVLVPGYDVFYESSDASTWQRFEEGLFHCLEWASGSGVMVAMENVDAGKVDSITQVMKYVNALNSPWFQVYLDMGNLAACGYNVLEQLELGRDHIVGIHVKDTLPKLYRRVPFGTGIVPFVEVFRRLTQLNFRGPALIEMWADEKEADAVNVITSARCWVVERMAEGWTAACQDACTGLDG
jgi:L-ribulose-5-phosphate 3-epimerase